MALNNGRGTVVGPGAGGVATKAEDTVTLLLGFWYTGGLLLDAWAHTNVIHTIENFYTPWHAVFYSGFIAMAAWTFRLAYRRRRDAPRWWRDGWPAGYRMAGIASVFFLAAGLGDMTWHGFLGVEVGLDVALSPTHMLLTASGVWLVTSPVRSWWAAGTGGWRAVTGVVSLALGTVFATVLLTYYSAFVHVAPTQSYDPNFPNGPSEFMAVRGVMSYLITTFILAVPLLLAHRRRTTPGLVTALVGAFVLFDMIMFEFPAPQTGAGVVAVGAAIVADVVLVRVDAIRGFHARHRLPVAGALFALIVWSGHMLGLQLFSGNSFYPAHGVRWTPELWTGAIALSAVVAGVLGAFLAMRPAQPGGTGGEVAERAVAVPPADRSVRA